MNDRGRRGNHGALAADHRLARKREKTPPTLGWPAADEFSTLPSHPTPVTPVMLLIAIFSVTVLLLCWLCYSGESKR